MIPLADRPSFSAVNVAIALQARGASCPYTTDHAPSAQRAGMPRAVIYRGEEKAVRKASLAIFERPLSYDDWALLAGAGPFDEVEVGVYRDAIHVELTDPTRFRYRGVYSVFRHNQCANIRIEAFQIHRVLQRGQRLGLSVFARQVLASGTLGIGRFETYAGREHGQNGYYSWPRWGFDGLIPLEVRRRLPDLFSKASRISQLMATEPGRLWWRKNGVAVHLDFDPTPTSPHRKRLREYVLSSPY